MWNEVERIADWLNQADAANPNLTELESLLIRMLKITEEFGELATAVVGYTGQNPRKGVTHTKEDVVKELCDVILSAMVALATIQPAEDVHAAVHNHVLEVFTRAGLRH